MQNISFLVAEQTSHYGYTPTNTEGWKELLQTSERPGLRYIKSTADFCNQDPSCSVMGKKDFSSIKDLALHAENNSLVQLAYPWKASHKTVPSTTTTEFTRNHMRTFKGINKHQIDSCPLLYIAVVQVILSPSAVCRILMFFVWSSFVAKNIF